LLSKLRDAIAAPVADTGASARGHLDHLTKPPGSLGRLEEIAVRLAVVRGGPPRVERPVVFVFAADHGVVAEGMSAYPQIVTAQMVRTFWPEAPPSTCWHGRPARASSSLTSVSPVRCLDRPA